MLSIVLVIFVIVLGLTNSLCIADVEDKLICAEFIAYE